MKTIGSALFKSLGAAYRALNMIGFEEQIAVIEFAPLGSQAHIIMTGPQDLVQQTMNKLHYSDVERTDITINAPDVLLKAYLGQEVPTLQSTVLLVEASFVGDLFKTGTRLIELGFHLVDIRVQRVVGSPGYLVATGNPSGEALRAATALSKENLSVTALDQLSRGFKDYFQITPS
ncbi:MAG: hypothetical protein BroJett040_08710 [Oligoflexia bacterium]|nr:MAG: hypothetical protein BroJett040_08710 [Oligoflexia bacterium]